MSEGWRDMDKTDKHDTAPDISSICARYLLDISSVSRPSQESSR